MQNLINDLKNYTNDLQNIINSYNNSYHRSIKTSPNSVTEKNQEKIRLILYPKKKTLTKIAFRKGDYVRKIEDKTIFDKGYTPNWTLEIFIVKNILLREPPVYQIQTITGIELKGYFYKQELQKIEPKQFPYDAFEVVSDSTENEVAVKKLNSESDKSTRVLRKR